MGGIGVAILRITLSDEWEPNRVLGSLALGAPYMAAGVVGVAGVVRHRASLVAGCGLSAFALSVVSLILWPLVLPAGALIVRSVAMARRPDPRGLAVTVLCFFGLFAAVTVLVVGEDGASGTTEDGVEWSASDVVTTGEAWLALGLTAATLSGVLYLDANRRIDG